MRIEVPVDENKLTMNPTMSKLFDITDGLNVLEVETADRLDNKLCVSIVNIPRRAGEPVNVTYQVGRFTLGKMMYIRTFVDGHPNILVPDIPIEFKYEGALLDTLNVGGSSINLEVIIDYDTVTVRGSMIQTVQVPVNQSIRYESKIYEIGSGVDDYSSSDFPVGTLVTTGAYLVVEHPTNKNIHCVKYAHDGVTVFDKTTNEIMAVIPLTSANMLVLLKSVELDNGLVITYYPDGHRKG